MPSRAHLNRPQFLKQKNIVCQGGLISMLLFFFLIERERENGGERFLTCSACAAAGRVRWPSGRRDTWRNAWRRRASAAHGSAPRSGRPVWSRCSYTGGTNQPRRFIPTLVPIQSLTISRLYLLLYVVPRIFLFLLHYYSLFALHWCSCILFFVLLLPSYLVPWVFIYLSIFTSVFCSLLAVSWFFLSFYFTNISISPLKKMQDHLFFFSLGTRICKMWQLLIHGFLQSARR